MLKEFIAEIKTIIGHARESAIVLQNLPNCEHTVFAIELETVSVR